MPKAPRPRLTIARLNEVSKEDFAALVGSVFEHSSWIAEQTAGLRPFPDLTALHGAMAAVVASSSPARQLALVRAHPDLAGRLAQQGRLTAESRREQAAAGLNATDDATIQRIQSLNTTYRERFDFPFVICARLNNVETIVAAMEQRVQHDSATELSTALDEIYKIARLRLDDLVIH